MATYFLFRTKALTYRKPARSNETCSETQTSLTYSFQVSVLSKPNNYKALGTSVNRCRVANLYQLRKQSGKLGRRSVRSDVLETPSSMERSGIRRSSSFIHTTDVAALFVAGSEPLWTGLESTRFCRALPTHCSREDSRKLMLTTR